MLACLKKQIGFTEERPSIPSAGESKKQLQNRTISTAKHKTQWFCAVLAEPLTEYLPHKTKCRCFFDVYGPCVSAHCWIDEALWVLWRSKMRSILEHN